MAKIFYISANDAATYPVDLSEKIVYDATAPEITGIEDNDTYYKQASFGFKDEQSGIASVLVDGQPAAANNGTLDGDSSTEAITLPADPTRRGYIFKEWYTEASGGTQVTTAMVVQENTTIYARWTRNSSGGVSTYTATVEETGNGFVKADYTRAQMVTFLHRYFGD